MIYFNFYLITVKGILSKSLTVLIINKHTLFRYETVILTIAKTVIINLI